MRINNGRIRKRYVLICLAMEDDRFFIYMTIDGDRD